MAEQPGKILHITAQGAQSVMVWGYCEMQKPIILRPHTSGDIAESNAFP
jgi:hypothetical protein